LSRAFVWRALAALAAIVTAALVAGDLTALHQHAHDLGAPRPVVVARRDLVVGHVVAARDVELVTRYGSQVAAGAVRDAASVVGHVITLSVAAGAPLLARNVSALDAAYDVVIPPGHRIIRVPDTTALDPAPGEVVDVIATPHDDGAAGATTVVAQGALVIEGDRAPTATRNDAGVTATVRDSDLGVALLVTADDAPRLAAAVANEQVVLALAPAADVCCDVP
jgi:pilus assembly protein CpaB